MRLSFADFGKAHPDDVLVDDITYEDWSYVKVNILQK